MKEATAFLPYYDHDDAWPLRAACQREDPEIFFHPDGERGPARSRRQAAARAICARCPVIEQCLDYSIRADERYGMWGGLDEEERARLIARKSMPQATVTVEAS